MTVREQDSIEIGIGTDAPDRVEFVFSLLFYNFIPKDL